ncbi:late control protein D [Terrarubrum flagellatum]|uniref:phage late control D family protein n=1 Tax=Terrirubrum flagellatum TaxID=2895980 RepID=UPI00314524BE
MSVLRPVHSVIVDGNDVTSRILPRLLEVEVVDKEGTSSDTAEIKLADPDGTTILPQPGAKISIALGFAPGAPILVFEGTVDDPESQFGKGQVRTLSISAKGFDTKGKAKQPQRGHADNQKFGDVATKWARAAGLEAKIDSALGSIQRDYWSIDGESFLHWGQRVAREIGANFKVSGGRAIFVPINGATSASGQSLTPIRAIWGDNLKSGRIRPYSGRGRFKEVKTRYYDAKEAKWKEKTVSVADNKAEANLTTRFNAHDEGEAEGKATTEKKRSEKEGGAGEVTIVGEPTARATATVQVRGVRPGVDGDYIATTVTHKATKTQFDTKVSLKRPTGDAGKDTRKASK